MTPSPKEVQEAPAEVHAAGPNPPPESRGKSAVLFSSDSVAAFYASLIHRYFKRFGMMIALSMVYAAIAAGRLLAGGVMLECVQANNKYKLKDLDLLPRIEVGLGWLGFGAVDLVGRLADPDFFLRFLGVSAGLFLVVATVMVIVSYAKAYLGQSLVVRMVVDIRQALFGHLTHQSVAYFNRQRSGDVISRLTNDISAIQLSFRFFFQTVVHEPITIVAFLLLALYQSWVLFVLVVPLYALLVLPIRRSGKKIRKHGRHRLEKLSLVTEDIHQLSTGIRIDKAFNMEEHERQEFARRNRGYIKSTLKMNRAKIRGRSIQEFLYNIGTAGLVLFGGWLLLTDSGVFTPVEFFLFGLAMVSIYTPLKALSRAWNQIQESNSGVVRVLQVLGEEPDLRDRDGARPFPGLQSRIAFENVSFSYQEASPDGAGEAVVADSADSASPRVPETPVDGTDEAPSLPVVRELSFEALAGEVVALVGPSGAGKTTIADLIARFYDPQQGRIIVDGVDIRDFRNASYLKGIAIVSQDPFLFNSTIRENLAYGSPNATQKEIEEAAKVAFAHDFILEQPNGYETVLGERGVLLSGGQRQRLTIARAVLKDAPILILDEATSALDTESERIVQRAMENLMRERTTFVIAHRLSTIVEADKILVLEGGFLKEVGRHEELLARKGKYYQLWRSQNPDGES